MHIKIFTLPGLQYFWLKSSITTKILKTKKIKQRSGQGARNVVASQYFSIQNCALFKVP